MASKFDCAVSELDSEALSMLFEKTYFGKKFSRDELEAFFDYVLESGRWDTGEPIPYSELEGLLSNVAVFNSEAEVLDEYEVESLDQIEEADPYIMAVIEVPGSKKRLVINSVY